MHRPLLCLRHRCTYLACKASRRKKVQGSANVTFVGAVLCARLFLNRRRSGLLFSAAWPVSLSLCVSVSLCLCLSVRLSLSLLLSLCLSLLWCVPQTTVNPALPSRPLVPLLILIILLLPVSTLPTLTKLLPFLPSHLLLVEVISFFLTIILFASIFIAFPHLRSSCASTSIPTTSAHQRTFSRSNRLLSDGFLFLQLSELATQTTTFHTVC